MNKFERKEQGNVSCGTCGRMPPTFILYFLKTQSKQYQHLSHLLLPQNHIKHFVWGTVGLIVQKEQFSGAQVQKHQELFSMHAHLTK